MAAVPTRAREVHLVSRPKGAPADSDAEVVEADVREPGPGEVVVRNLAMSVDPYMRGRMNDVKSYVPPFQLGAVMAGGAVGEVVAAPDGALAEGTVVSHGLGWREYAVLPARHAQPVDTGSAPVTAALGVLGMPGMTAYVGLLDIAALADGETAFVSGAAGAVGGVAGQIAKAKGCRVIGSAGSAEKVAHLRDVLGFDEAFSYRDGPVADSLAAAAPDGIDVYFDNVGGDILDAVLRRLANRARVVLCGAVSQYNAETGMTGPSNYMQLLITRSRMEGFVVFDYADRYAEATKEMAGWLSQGRLVSAETVVEGGVREFPSALLQLFSGGNTGKLVLHVAD